jgi:hypothetical protein
VRDMTQDQRAELLKRPQAKRRLGDRKRTEWLNQRRLKRDEDNRAKAGTVVDFTSRGA